MSPAGWYQSQTRSHADKFLKVTNPGNDNFDWAGLVFLFLPFSHDHFLKEKQSIMVTFSSSMQ